MAGLGLNMAEAARMGVFLHGLAGDLVAADNGVDGIVASDLMQMLPAAMRLAREGGPWDPHYAGPLKV